jgi:hypothetical protein
MKVIHDGVRQLRMILLELIDPFSFKSVLQVFHVIFCFKRLNILFEEVKFLE